MKNLRSDWEYFMLRRMLIILALGFASGLPLALSGNTLQAWYTMEEMSVVMIGFIALAGQPYAFKFFWAPVVDKYRFPYLGLRRGWIVAMQGILIALLMAMGMMDPAVQPYQLGFLALCLAFFSATQDIAIDAYRTELLLPDERGLGTSMAVGGYRIAMLVSGGMALIIAHYIGFRGLYFFMAGLMLIGVLAVLVAPEPHHPPITKEINFLKTCFLPFKEFLSRNQAFTILAFIIFYKLGDAFALSLATTFLLKGVGFTLVEIGGIYKTVGLAATLLGVFSGGVLMIKLGLFRSLLFFGIAQAVTNLLFCALAKVGPNYALMVSTVFLENFAGGLATAAYMAFIMSLCNPQFTATQFALLSALSAVGRIYVGPASGYLVEWYGWYQFFILSILFALPGLILLVKLKKIICYYGSRSEEEAIQASVEEARA